MDIIVKPYSALETNLNSGQVCKFIPKVAVGAASANSVKFNEIRPRMYIEDLL